MEQSNWFYRILLWREKHIKESVFILIIAFLVGIASSLAAALLKTTISHIQDFVIYTTSLHKYNFSYLIFPVLGILLSGLFVRYILKDDISHGVTQILYALSQRKSRIKSHNMWSSLVASSVTIGFGGSVGAESPIVLTGAAIGSNLGQTFRLEQKNLMLLVGCGAAGAVAGIFKAPITGLVFVIEVLMLDLTLTSVLPLLISSVTGATLSYIMFGTEAMFSFSHSEVFTLDRLPFVIFLGILCGLVSLYFTKVSFSLEKRFKKIDNYWVKYAISAVILSALIFLLPPLYGEGYLTISALINGEGISIMSDSLFADSDNVFLLLPIFVLLVIITKVFATVATNSGGGCGGVFAPSLFLGCLTGFLFAYLMNYAPFGPYLPTKNFALMGMAGVMAGIMHAPLTGVFLIAELTGGYGLFLPLMVVSISSYATIKIFLPHSIYSLRLAEKGELLTHRKDQAVLTLLSVENVIEKDFNILNPEMTLGEMVQVFGKSKRNLFPVVTENGQLVGIVLLDNIRNIMFRQELYDRFTVSKFMVSPPGKINIHSNMEEVMRLFDDTGAWNLPVVDEQGRYLGFVSKSKIFSSYRNMLITNFDG